MRKLLLLSLFFCAAFQTTNAQVIFSDDFESYNTADPLANQASHWGTWSACTPCNEDGLASGTRAYSGTQSLEIFGQGGPQDVLLLLGDSTSGRYKLSWKMYVEENNRAFFNHQKCETQPGSCWGYELVMEEVGTGDIDANGGSVAQFTYRQGRWMDVIHYFDLDNQWGTLIIDTAIVYSWDISQSSQGTSAPINQIGAIDFYATSVGPHWFYIDDIVFEKLPSMAAKSSVARLHLDMHEELLLGSTISTDGIHIAGNFNGWSPDVLMMTDNMDSTYYGFINVENNTQAEYKFINGNAWGGDETVPMDCGIDNGQGSYNRAIMFDSTNIYNDPICFNKCVACDLTISTEPIELAENVSVFPNPASAFVTVELDFAEATTIQLNLFNSIGQVLRQENLGKVSTMTTTFSVKDLPKGIYFLQIKGEGTQATQKLIIE